MSAILSNRWVQLILVMLFFSIAKGFLSGILSIENHPTISVTMAIQRHEWGRAAFVMLYDLGEGAFMVMVLRAVGAIEFVSRM